MKQLRLSIYCFLNNIQTHRQTATTWFLYTCVGTLLWSKCAWASIVPSTISKHTDKRLLLGSCIPAWALCCQATAPEHRLFPVQYPNTQTNGYYLVPVYLRGHFAVKQLRLSIHRFLYSIQTHRQMATTWFLLTCAVSWMTSLWCSASKQRSFSLSNCASPCGYQSAHTLVCVMQLFAQHLCLILWLNLILHSTLTSSLWLRYVCIAFVPQSVIKSCIALMPDYVIKLNCTALMPQFVSTICSQCAWFLICNLLQYQ